MSRAGRARATPSSKAAADSRPLKEQHEPPGPGAYPSPTSMGKQALSTKRSAPSTRFCGADRGWEYFNVFVSEQSAHKGRDTPGPGNYPLRSTLNVSPAQPGPAPPTLGKYGRVNTEGPGPAREECSPAHFPPTSFGQRQAESKKPSAPAVSLGGSTRQQALRLYAGPPVAGDEPQPNLDDGPGHKYSHQTSSLGKQVTRRTNPGWTLYRPPERDTKPRRRPSGKPPGASATERKALERAHRAYKRSVAKASLAAAEMVIDSMVHKAEEEEADKFRTWKAELHSHFKAVEDAEKAERERILKLAAEGPVVEEDPTPDAVAAAEGGGADDAQENSPRSATPTERDAPSHESAAKKLDGAALDGADTAHLDPGSEHGDLASPSTEGDEDIGDEEPKSGVDALGEPPEPPFVPLEGGSIYTSITPAQYARLSRDERRARRTRLREEKKRQKRLEQARRALQKERGILPDADNPSLQTRDEKAVRMLERLHEDPNATAATQATSTGFFVTQPKPEPSDAVQLRRGGVDDNDQGGGASLQAHPGRHRRDTNEQQSGCTPEDGDRPTSQSQQRPRSLLTYLGGERWEKVEQAKVKLVPKASLDRVASYHWLNETQKKMHRSHSEVKYNYKPNATGCELGLANKRVGPAVGFTKASRFGTSKEFHPHAIPGTTGGPTIGPGPARYMPPSCFGADTAQYSFPKDKKTRLTPRTREKAELPGPGQYAANDDEAWQAASNNLSALAHKANQDATVIEQQLSWAETTRQAGLTVRVGQSASAQLLGPVPTFGHTRAPSVSSANSAFRKAAAAATAAQEEAEQFERWQKQRLQEAKRQKQVFRSRQKAFLGSSIRYRSAPAIGFGSGRRSADAKMSSGLVDVRQVGHDSPGPVTAKHRDSFSNHHAGGITMAPDCTSRSQPLKKATTVTHTEQITLPGALGPQALSTKRSYMGSKFGTSGRSSLAPKQLFGGVGPAAIPQKSSVGPQAESRFRTPPVIRMADSKRDAGYPVNATPGPGRYVMPAIRDHRGGLFSK